MKTKKITIPARVVQVTFDEYVGGRICGRRIDLGLSQEALASLCNISKSFLSDCENGKRSIEFCKLYEVAKVLKRTTDWFSKGWD